MQDVVINEMLGQTRGKDKVERYHSHPRHFEWTAPATFTIFLMIVNEKRAISVLRTVEVALSKTVFVYGTKEYLGSKFSAVKWRNFWHLLDKDKTRNLFSSSVTIQMKKREKQCKRERKQRKMYTKTKSHFILKGSMWDR